MAAALALLLGGCQGAPYECCSARSDGELGTIGTCHRSTSAIDEYGVLYGHERCTDDPAGRACVAWTYGHEWPDLECFGEGGPSYAVECCEDVDDTGVGTLATCRCPAGGLCAWHRGWGLVAEPVGEGRCRIRDDRPCAATDGGCPDAGS